MKKSVHIASASQTILRQHVYSSLNRLFQHGATAGRIGLAVSGGVDSMALASLCSSYQATSPRAGVKPRAFHAFVVDHGLRRNSAQEAAAVAGELDRLHITPRILTLDWGVLGDPAALSNFETVARRLRYRALGRACGGDHIQTLLTGHHAGDQAETVLARIVDGYLGSGLAGIRPECPIPECAGIYGADGSGYPRFPAEGRRGMAVEGGGIRLQRPFLTFPKEALITVCRDSGVRWFEDATNSDKTLTVRNTVRFLQLEGCLPAALRCDRLMETAAYFRARDTEYQESAARIFDNMSVNLDLCCGKVSFIIPQIPESEAAPYPVKARVTRLLLSLVTNNLTATLEGLYKATDFLFGGLSHCPAVQVGPITIRRCTTAGLGQPRFYAIRRTPKAKHDDVPFELYLSRNHDDETNTQTTKWSEWQLWDGRYWVRLGYTTPSPPSPTPRFFVTHLTPEEIGNLRRSIPKECVERRILDASLQPVPSDTKFALPVITAVHNDVEEEVLALPSLGWCNPASVAGRAGWIWEIRYKAVELGRGPRHVFEDASRDAVETMLTRHERGPGNRGVTV